MGDTSFTIPMSVASGDFFKNTFYDILCVFKSVHYSGKDVLALNPKKCKNQKHDIHIAWPLRKDSVRMLGKSLTSVEVQEHVQPDPRVCKTHPQNFTNLELSYKKLSLSKIKAKRYKSYIKRKIKLYHNGFNHIRNQRFWSRIEHNFSS